MIRWQRTRTVVTALTTVTLFASVGCRSVARQGGSPTPLSAPATTPSLPPSPDAALQIPPTPPSTVQAPRSENPFGFTAPRLSNEVMVTDLELPRLPNVDDEVIQPTASDESPAVAQQADNAAADLAVVDPTAPLLMPLPLAVKTRSEAPVQLDTSLFLMDLFEDAAIEIPGDRSVPVTVNGMSIQPWSLERNLTNSSNEPQAWPTDGVTPTLTITPGPILPKWTSEPLPTRPAGSRPRRLMIENSDSVARPIE